MRTAGTQKVGSITLSSTSDSRHSGTVVTVRRSISESSHIAVTALTPRRALLGALLVALLLAYGTVVASADAVPAATQHCPRTIGEKRSPWIGRAEHITT